MKPRICIDFDGTIFDGRGIFPGCIEALGELRRRYTIAIFSARATDQERGQMRRLLDDHGVPYDEILERKPEANYYIDDKGVRFESWAKVIAFFDIEGVGSQNPHA